MALIKDELFSIKDVYIPSKRRKTLQSSKVIALAESILEEGMKVPIQVRKGNGRFVLVEGLHRLEACQALGETKIACIIVHARNS